MIISSSGSIVRGSAAVDTLGVLVGALIQWHCGVEFLCKFLVLITGELAALGVDVDGLLLRGL
jgi:hypothetical protein